MQTIYPDRYTRHEVTALRAGGPSGRTQAKKGTLTFNSFAETRTKPYFHSQEF
jgi:hypothetical protein